MGNDVKTYKTDLLIIGGGGAAAIAAIEAVKNGVTPLLVCKDTFIGGATVQASGGISIPFLPEDSASTFFEDTIKSGAYINNVRLVKILSEEAQTAFYELEKDGCVLDRLPSGYIRAIKKSEGHSVLRSYGDRRQLHGIVGALKRKVFQESINVLEERVLLKIFADQEGVQGGLFFSLEHGSFEVISSPVIILATGGCGQLYQVTTNARCLTGDGYAIAFEAGAELVDMEMVQFLPLAFPYPPSVRGTIIGMCSLFGPGVRLYNGLGERYMERYEPQKLEYATRDVVARANYLEIQEGRGTKRKTIIVDPTHNDRTMVNEYRKSHAVVYDMIAEIFGEKAANWEAPFEAIPSQHFMMGGVKIDENCRTSVRNLYCCGEVSGGIHGANRLAGNALTEIFVFGRRAGREASEAAKKTSQRHIHKSVITGCLQEMEEYLKSSGNVPVVRIRDLLQRTMWEKVGIVREGEEIEKALTILNQLEKMLKNVRITCRNRYWNREWMEALELPLMIRTAKLIAISALTRTESRGSHYRRDYPHMNENWRKNIVLCKGEDGEIKVGLQEVIGGDT